VRYDKLENLAYLGKEPFARLQSTSGLHGLDDGDDLLGFYLVDRLLTYDGYVISSKKALYTIPVLLIANFFVVIDSDPP